MNVSLPRELERFVLKRVKEGAYENEAEVVYAALRELRERERRHNADGFFSAPSDKYEKAISNLNLGDTDIEAVAFIVLMEATKSMDADLKMVMAEVRAMTAAKSKLRELISKVKRDIANNSGQKDGKPSLNFQNGMGGEKSYHAAAMPFADPESKGGVRFVVTDLFEGKISCVSQLVAIAEELKNKLDSLSEMSEMTMLRLQMMMDRRSKFISTLSNVMKKISSTQQTIVDNLK